MAKRKKCPNCGQKIDAKATVCPECGVTIVAIQQPKQGLKTTPLIVLLGLCMCLALAWYASQPGENEPLTAVSPELDPSIIPIMAPPIEQILSDTENMTDAQFEEYARALEDNMVTGWTGTVMEVREGGGGYRVSVDMVPGNAQEVQLNGIDKATALSLDMDEAITFNGRIIGAGDTFGLLLVLDDVEIIPAE